MISRNIKLLKMQKFLHGLWPLAILIIVYFETVTNSYATAMAVFSFSLVVQGITEISTGVFSDKIGRRRTIILSRIMQFIAYLSWAIAGNLVCVPLLFFGACAFGLAQSLNSGTDEAFIYETMVELKNLHNFDKIFASTEGLFHLGRLVSVFIATVVIFYFDSSPYSLQVLAWVSIVPLIPEFIIILFFVEPNVKKKKVHTVSSFRHFKEAFKLMIKNKKLRVFSIFSIVSEATDYSLSKTLPVYYTSLIPLYLVTVVDVMKECANTISYFIAPYFRKFGFHKLPFIFGYLICGVRLISVIINNFVSPFIMAASNIMGGIAYTAQVAVLQKEFSDKQRATMGSIVSTLISFVLAILFYVLGIVADIYSFRVVVLILILMRLSVIIYTSFRFKKLGL